MQTFMRFIFSVYMLLLVVCFGMVVLDSRSGAAPMSGTFAVLASYAAGLPWTDIAAHAMRNRGNVDDVVFHFGWIGAAVNVFLLGYLSGFWLAGTDGKDVDVIAPDAQGYCPNCGAQLPGSTPECKQCGALFGPGSGWRLLREPKEKARNDG